MTHRLHLILSVAACAIALASVSAQKQGLTVTRHKAEAGDAIAQFDLARAYIYGEGGVAVDPKEGLRWLRKSTDQGYVGAEYAMGYIYQTGSEGLPKDQHEAAKWFVKAARQQNKKSQDQLLDMVAKGLISAHEANWHVPDHAAPSASKPAKSGAAPFSVAEVETGLKSWITTRRMAALVQQFGVDFTLSDATRKRLAGAGADPVLLQVISTSKRSL
ncbi:MAG: tetratricopeptide repeat protein [Myxococcaceae bacterium]